jgi:hypothetical protein
MSLTISSSRGVREPRRCGHRRSTVVEANGGRPARVLSGDSTPAQPGGALRSSPFARVGRAHSSALLGRDVAARQSRDTP